MGRSLGSRALLAIGVVVAALVASLAVVQYRWSGRVAAADEHREQEHLESAASLLATEFNGLSGQLMTFLQNEAREALRHGERLASVPKLAGELYYIDLRTKGDVKAQRLGSDGMFTPVALPEWITFDRCATVAIEQPPALVAPIYNVVTLENRTASMTEVRKSFNGQPDQCFVARIDVAYLRGTLFPKLIRDSFGESGLGEYDFAVVSPAHPEIGLYGKKGLRPDLKKTFFSAQPMQLSDLSAGRPLGRATVFVRHLESTVIGRQLPPGDLFGPGIWELDVAHRGEPLAVAFENRRRRDFLLSLGVELLLVAAMAFVIISARRMQDLANRKMRFVAECRMSYAHPRRRSRCFRGIRRTVWFRGPKKCSSTES